jgi:hypothetical protein
MRVWDEIWPNLAANVLWVPLAWVHHVLIKRHINRMSQTERRTEEQ